MAGSFNHIVDKQGAFTMSTIDNMGDAREALEECFDLIAVLLDTGVSGIDRDHDTEAWFRAAYRSVVGPGEPKARPIVKARADDTY